MSPDETNVAQWLDEELSPPEMVEMDAWAADKPEQLAAREEMKFYKSTLSQNIPAVEEIPYPDFFNTKVMQGIRDQEALVAPATSRTKSAPFWRSWLLPIAACAGLMVAFTLGRQTSQSTIAQISDRETSAESSPIVYTPQDGVRAEWFSDNRQTASVIILQGIDAIPDSIDFSQTVYMPSPRMIDRMADASTEDSKMRAQ